MDNRDCLRTLPPTDPMAESLSPSNGEEREGSCGYEVAGISVSPSPVHSSSSSSFSSSTCEDDDGNSVDSWGSSSHRHSGSAVKLLDGSQATAFSPEDAVISINAGGTSRLSLPSGLEFHEDSSFIGGDVLRTGEAISQAQEPALYQTARYGDFSYLVPDLKPGDYLVDLHFAEIIFTNGPPGMRIFDVLVQNKKVVAALDIYAKVGSNTPLILEGAPATVKKDDKGLLISFRGIAGTPTISGICVRSRPSTISGLSNVSELQQEASELVTKVQKCKSEMEDIKLEMQRVDITVDAGIPQNHRTQEKKGKRGSSRGQMREFKRINEELKKECHQAWMSVQDSNTQKEKLQNELDSKSFQMDSLASAVEAQLNEIKDLKEKASVNKEIMSKPLLKLAEEVQALKRDHALLANDAHIWVQSFPAINEMSGKIEALVNESRDLKRRYAEESMERRLLYNKVLELKGNIRVFCRCRPMSTSEIASGASSVVEFDESRDCELNILTAGGHPKKNFKFDRVFAPSDGQEDVFADTVPVVTSVLDGYNVCIFAYGQTGTGKTFTMEGTEVNRGVNYRTLEELFNVAYQRKGSFSYEITVSVVEVYNEQIRDLLLTSPPAAGQTIKKLEIKQAAEGSHHVPGLTEASVQSIEEAWQVLQTGSSARAVGSTNANEHSSRSHCMLCVMVRGENVLTGECTKSKLWLVDLAGSERLAKTDVQGERLKEAQSINKSLSALGDVIYSLSTKSSHIPYRNSKLTHLLQDSLGGESKTLMFVQISPSENDLGETLCSLNFASRVRGVELGPAKKQLDHSELSKYKNLVEKARQDGRSKEDAVKKLEESMKMKESICKALTDKVKEKDKVVNEVEGHLISEKKSRITLEMKVKEQQLMIERLRDQLKSASAKQNHLQQVSALSENNTQQRQPFRENTNTENTNPSEVNSGIKFLHQPMKENSNGVGIGGAGEMMKIFEHSMLSNKPKLLPPRFNSPPDAAKQPTRKASRVSICGTVPPPRKRMSMATPSVSENPKDETLTLDGGGPNRVISEPISTTFTTPLGRRSSMLAPGSILRRSIPRKVHFRSPHLQPQRTVDRFMEIRKKREMQSEQTEQKQQQQGSGGGTVKNIAKLRRASMSHKPVTRDAFFPSSGGGSNNLGGGGGGLAQRVALSNAVPPHRSTIQQRERGWSNR